MNLATCVHQFFHQYLRRLKGVQDNTLLAYRDAFALFLPFAANRHAVKVASLRLEHLSAELVLAFLDHLDQERNNAARTRNQRLAALKSFAKMIRLLHPEHRDLAEAILRIPQKRTSKKLIGFLYQEEILKVFEKVDLRRKEGFRDYTLLHLLYDSGARASEISNLSLEDFDAKNRTLTLVGKGDKYRQIELWLKTTQLIQSYISKHRGTPKPLYRHRLLISQRGEQLTRHGIYRICQKYLSAALEPKRLAYLNPVHSFRHSCAVYMLSAGYSLADIRNRLGHEDLQSTMVYLHMDLIQKRRIQKKFIEYTKSSLVQDPKVEELIGWENKDDILAWLDTL